MNDVKLQEDARMTVIRRLHIVR